MFWIISEPVPEAAMQVQVIPPPIFTDELVGFGTASSLFQQSITVFTHIFSDSSFGITFNFCSSSLLQMVDCDTYSPSCDPLVLFIFLTKPMFSFLLSVHSELLSCPIFRQFCGLHFDLSFLTSSTVFTCRTQG